MVPESSTLLTLHTAMSAIYFDMAVGAHRRFSQWYVRSMNVDGATYNCAEQFYAWCIASKFGDFRSAAEIMDTYNDPERCSDLGKNVRGFNAQEWANCRSNVLYCASLSKFSNTELAGVLISTNGHEIVYANSRDRALGVGFNEDTAHDHRRIWGENLLGQALMRVREHIQVPPHGVVRVWVDGSCMNDGMTNAQCSIGVHYPHNDNNDVSRSLAWGKMSGRRAELSVIAFVLCTNPGSSHMLIHTASEYAIKCILEYRWTWQYNGWKGPSGSAIESAGIIRTIWRLIVSRCAMGGMTTLVYVRSYGMDSANVMAKRLAVASTRNRNPGALLQFIHRTCKIEI